MSNFIDILSTFILANVKTMWKLKHAHLPYHLLTNFYRSAIESLLTYCCTVWFSSCTAQDRKDLQWVVRAVERVIGMTLTPLTDIYTGWIKKKASCIVKDPTHPRHYLFPPCPLGRGVDLSNQRLRDLGTVSSHLPTGSEKHTLVLYTLLHIFFYFYLFFFILVYIWYLSTKELLSVFWNKDNKDLFYFKSRLPILCICNLIVIFLVEISVLVLGNSKLSGSDKKSGLRCKMAEVMTGFILLSCNSSDDKPNSMKLYGRTDKTNKT